MSARPSSAGAVDEWLATVARVDSRDIRLGLARAERVARALDLPPPIPAVVVGGTNGKGSVCALLEAALRASGLRVGCYGSPHLFRFHERIRVDGVEVDDDALLSAFEAVDAARRALDEELTYFEFATLAALWIFARARPDAMVLEVGLGGRLDAVNLVDAEVAAITNIALDHIEYLGGTRDSIGREKAGVLRRGRAAVCGDKNPPPGFADAARQIGAEVRYLGADFDFKVASDYAVSPRRPWRFCGRRLAVDLPPPAMPGFCQTQNAAVAVAALEALAESKPDLRVDAGAIRKGLHEAFLPARAQVIAGSPPLVVDVAHNPHAAAALADNLAAMGFFARTAVVAAMRAEKTAVEFFRALACRVDCCFAFAPAEDGFYPPDRLAEAARAAGIEARACADYSTAVAAARASDRIVVCGSFAAAGAALANGRETR